MEKFVSELWVSLQKELSGLEQKGLTTIEMHKSSLQLCDKVLQELKLYIYAYRFVDQSEEIFFHKILAPKFNAAYIFHYRAWQFLLAASIHGKKAMSREHKEINRFFLRNMELHAYMTRSDNYMDMLYFTKGSLQLQIPFSEEYAQIMDQQFVTTHSYKIAQLCAYKRLYTWLEGRQTVHTQNTGIEPQAMALNWTETGMSLTEIAYALKYSGAVNKGNVDVKEIAETLGRAFNTKPVNVYRNKQDLYSRKNQSMFLDKLRKELIKGLEESDNG